MRIRNDEHEIFPRERLKERMAHDAQNKVAKPAQKVHCVCAHR